MIDYITNFDHNLILTLNNYNSLFMDSLMLTFTSGLTWIPIYVALFYLIIKNNETILQILWTIFCILAAVGISYVLADFVVKPMVERLRPCNEPSLKGLLHIIPGYNLHDYSFFSAHSSNTMTIAIFVSLLVRNRLLSTCMLLWSLLNAYTRIYLAAHYPSDVLVGLFVGVVIGLLMYVFYIKVLKRISHNSHFISTHYSPTGYALSDINIAILLIVCSVVYSIIKTLLHVGFN